MIRTTICESFVTARKFFRLQVWHVEALEVSLLQTAFAKRINVDAYTRITEALLNQYLQAHRSQNPDLLT